MEPRLNAILFILILLLIPTSAAMTLIGSTSECRWVQVEAVQPGESAQVWSCSADS